AGLPEFPNPRFSVAQMAWLNQLGGYGLRWAAQAGYAWPYWACLALTSNRPTTRSRAPTTCSRAPTPCFRALTTRFRTHTTPTRWQAQTMQFALSEPLVC